MIAFLLPDPDSRHRYRDVPGVRGRPFRAIGMPRTQPSCRGRTDDCIARMMRTSNQARSPSDASLLLLQGF